MADSVLLIDDDADVLRAVGNYFERLGYEVNRELTGEAGIATYERARPDVVILDLSLPGMDGLQVLERLREWDAAVILLTGHSDVPTAVKAMQLGAENFLTKPVDLPHLAAAVARVADKVRLKRVNSTLLTSGASTQDLESMGASTAMTELANQIRLLAQSERTTVLIEGETGTGKSWVARKVHDLSPRAKEPFVDVSCNGVSAQWLDSELFGHEKGAFPGAEERKTGLFEIADRGTVFIGEIGDLPPELQPKLLKVLETRAFRRLGGAREITVDVRLVAASGKNLMTEVEAGRFREDLFYRLSVMPLRVPAMRDRAREDRLSILTRVFADLKGELHDGPQTLSTEVIDRLLQYPWPGNVREMRNVLERAMLLGRGQAQMGIEHLPGELRARHPGGERKHSPLTLDDLERQHIERTLKYHVGNRTRAAAELGISRATLINKIKRYGLHQIGNGSNG